MGCIILYFKSLECDNITYSVDKLRLKTYLNYSTFTEIEFRFKSVWSGYIDKYYTSGQISSFFYNYVIKINDNNSFWFGFLHNTEKRNFNTYEQYNFTIEFNPNKIKDNKILLYILSKSKNWFIRSLDLAMDLPVSILDIIYDKGKKRNVKIFSNGFDNKTITIGQRGTDNYLKIYNKKKESNLDIKGELTRIEITKLYNDFSIKDISFLHFGDNFPVLFTNNYLYSFKDYEDKTLLAILYSVQNGFPLDMLSRRYKEKIKNLLEGRLSN